MKKAYLLILTFALALSSCKSGKYSELGDGIFADIQTSMGNIVIKLEFEKTPVTVANFISLAEGKNTFVKEEYKNKKYFDGLIFHRVMKDFMIQGGDPDASGSGGPGYKFIDEFNDSLVHNKKGIVSMANPGPPNTNGSQFFITHNETPWLNGKHSIFGEVVIGLEVVDSIATTPVAARNRPTEDVIMNKVEIIRNGKDARKFDAVEIMTSFFANEGDRLAAEEKEKQLKIEALEKVKEAFVTNLVIEKGKAETLASGLKILSIKKGTGDKPKIGSKVLVNYAGYLEDGTLFDSNYEEVAQAYNKFDQRRKDGGGYLPTPMTCSPDAQLIAGFREGLLSMHIGDKIRVFVPPHLGYGQQGGGPIPPNADLVFDLEITGLAE